MTRDNYKSLDKANEVPCAKMTTVPYNDWKTFYEAFKCSLDTEFFGEEYPEYEEYIDEEEDESIVKHLLANGCDPQEGIDGMMDALLFSSRYVSDQIDTIQKCMKLLFDAGAKLDGTKVFARTYDPSEATLEDEVNNYYSRAVLAMFLDPQVYVADWNEIQPKYWEDIPEDTDFDEARLMHLKDCYIHLSNAYIWE